MLQLTDEQKKACYASGYFRRYEFDFYNEKTTEHLFTLDASQIHTESVTIKEAICEETELKLGGCIASSCEFEVSEVLARERDLTGLKFRAILYLYEENQNPETGDIDNEDEAIGAEIGWIPMGEYRVQSVDMIDDKDYKKVTAYDDFYDWNIDVSEWYDKIFPDDRTVETVIDEGTENARVETTIVRGEVSVKQIRDSLVRYLMELDGRYISVDDMAKVFGKSYINDTVMVTKTIQSNGKLMAIELLKYLCEIAGGFGRINRYGLFEIVDFSATRGLYPEETLYPEDSKGEQLNLYPEDTFIYLGGGSDDDENVPDYFTAHYEEFDTQPISCVTFVLNPTSREESAGEETQEEYGVNYPPNATENPYVSSNPFLLELSEEELSEVAQNIYFIYSTATYRPNTTTLQGIPWYEPGDYYNLSKEFDNFESFVLSRTLTGIQGLRDEFVANGVKVRENNTNAMDDKYTTLAKYMSIHKSNEGLSIEVGDMQENATARFEMTATEISTEVAQNSDVWEEGSLNIIYRTSGVEWDSVKQRYYKKISISEDMDFFGTGKFILDTKTGKYFTCGSKEYNKLESIVTLWLTEQGQLTKKSVNMSTSITQNAEAITLEAQKREESDSGLTADYTSRFEVSAVQIQSEVSKDSVAWDESGEDIQLRTTTVSPTSGPDTLKSAYYTTVLTSDLPDNPRLHKLLDTSTGTVYYIKDTKLVTDNPDITVVYIDYYKQLKKVTTNLDTKIDQTAEEIKLSASQTYATKEAVESEFIIRANEISSSVSQAAGTWIEDEIDVVTRVYGLSYDEYHRNYAIEDSEVVKDVTMDRIGAGCYILDMQTGQYYKIHTASNGFIIDKSGKLIENKDKGVLYADNTPSGQLIKTTTDLSSQITQTASQIELTVKKGEVISSINQTAEAITIDASKVNLKGYVTATDLSGNGTTTINGANIKTGTIDADRISLKTVAAKENEPIVFPDSSGIKIGNTVDGRTLINNDNIVTQTVRGFTSNKTLYLRATSGSSSPYIELNTSELLLDGNGHPVEIGAQSSSFQVYTTSGFNYPVNLHDTVNLNSTVNSTGIRDATTSSAANCFINASTGHMGRSTASSKRYKHDITTDIKESLNPHKILDIPVSQYKYNIDYLNDAFDQRYNADVIGFIAEDVAEHYPVACEFDDYGMVENWNERYIIPPMLSLIQEMYQKINVLENKVIELGGNLS